MPCPVFEAVYPPYLKDAVAHAARMAALLDAMERPGRRLAEAWRTGRASEIACVVDVAVHDWRAGVVGEVGAARSVREYLRTLHAGLALHFGELAPRCCVGSLTDTSTPDPDRAETPALDLVLRAAAARAATWAEVDELELQSASA